MSFHPYAHHNPALDPNVGRIFVRVPQGKVPTNRNMRGDLISFLGAGNVYLYWIGDGKYMGPQGEKRIAMCAWKIEDPFEYANLKDCRVYDSEMEALSALRANYMGNTVPVTLYQVIISGTRISLVPPGTPFGLDRIPMSDPDRQAHWQAARPYPFPLTPEGAVPMTAAPQPVWYGPSAYGTAYPTYPVGHPFAGYHVPQPTGAAPSTHWMGGAGAAAAHFMYPVPGTPVPSGYVSGTVMTPQQSLDRLMIDFWTRATRRKENGPMEYHNWTGEPRKNMLATDYVGISMSPGLSPIAEVGDQDFPGYMNNRPYSIDPIPEAMFPALMSQLWNNLAKDAKSDPVHRAEVKKQKKTNMFDSPALIQWRVIGPIQRNDVRYYIAQWKFAYEPHLFEVSGTPIYRTF